MKRLTVFIFLSCMCIITSAHSVNSDQACYVAKRFFGFSQSSDDLKFAFAFSSSQTKAEATDSPELYAFNRKGGGFVIVSGDNSLKPIFGYSDSGNIGSYESLPDNMKWWLDVLCHSVKQKRKEGILPDKSLMREWENPRQIFTKSGTVVKSVPTVEWTQTSPFNDKCPLDNGVRSLAGCLPIALCEIMCYHKWPPSAEGEGLGTVYDWDQLCNVSGYNADGKSDAIKENLAQLVYDVGKTAQVQYSSTGTEGSSSYALKRIAGPFKYRQDSRYEKREFFDEEAWMKMITDEIDDGNPVFYSGVEIYASKQQAGHAYVIDGYDSDGFVHINWGWANGSNGYFWIGEKYFGSQDAYFNFVPDKTGSTEIPDGSLFLKNFKFNSGYYSFSPITEIKKGSIKFEVGYFINDFNGPYIGSVKLVHLDKNGNKKEDASASQRTPELSIGALWLAPYFTGTLYKDIEFGDRIAVYSGSTLDQSSWKPVKVSQQGESVPYYPLTPYAFIDAKKTYAVGERFYFKLFNNDFPYTWGGGNAELHTEWKFYLDGELKANITEYSARWYTLPSAGTWTVQATVKYVKDGSVKTVLSAQFEVNK